MSAVPIPSVPPARATADQMGERGHRTLWLHPRDKRPGLVDWPNKASCDPKVHAGWWPDGSERGLGWAMGPQDSGEFLVALDIDIAKGGKDSLNTLGSEHPWLIDLLMTGVFAQTGSGGFHFVIAVPHDVGAQLSNRARILPGIDVRSAGGQIAVEPSIHPNGRSYRWAQDHAPWDVDPVGDDRLFGLLLSLAAAPPVTPVSSPQSPSERDETIGDLVRQRERWQDWLPRWGWHCVGHRGDESFWKRPGKTDRGHSAVLHANGAFVVFSTEVPPILEGLGRPTKGGEGFSISLFNAIAAYEHGGDKSACARHFVREYDWGASARTVAVASGPALTPGSPAAVTEPQVTDRSLLPTLDEAFWSARPWLAHIRQAAHSKGMSADATLVNFFAVYAATIPPEYMTLDMLGTFGSLNYLACIVGPSGLGKTQCFRIARDLVGLPPHPKVRFGAQPGSGEGLIDAYLKPVKEVDPITGDKVEMKRQMMQGIHWYVDEGTALSAQAKRDGTTILQALCSGWSGSGLGQENAQKETWRRLDENKYRLSASISVQRDFANEFHSADMQGLGFTGRTHFVSVIDPTIPTRRIPHPGPLELKIWPGIEFGPKIIDFPAEVAEQLWEQHTAVGRGELDVPATESQHKLLHCKLAALIAMIEQRIVVTLDDWALAGTLLDTSARVVARLEAEYSRRTVAKLRANGVARAESELASEDRKEDAYITAMAERIVRTVLSDPSKRWGRNALRKECSSSATKHRFEPGLDRALSSHRVVMDGQAIVAP